MRLIPSLTLALAGTLLLAGCGSPAAPSGSPSPSPASFVGEWKGESSVHLTVKEGSDLQGNDGCNGFSGSYALEDSRIVVSNVLSTLKGCPGTDTWLSGIRSAEIDGDTLVVFGRDDQQIGTLERANS